MVNVSEGQVIIDIIGTASQITLMNYVISFWIGAVVLRAIVMIYKSIPFL